ncbi:hypothetical protein CRENBAI_021977 [Crenichthys baileyi]|uniref:Uncharacterized protein n=1 Tax=Crenichthys baileyi TaxID=28760 RepID=A0AAV9SBA9_9TELE
MCWTECCYRFSVGLRSESYFKSEHWRLQPDTGQFWSPLTRTPFSTSSCVSYIICGTTQMGLLVVSFQQWRFSYHSSIMARLTYFLVFMMLFFPSVFSSKPLTLTEQLHL